MFLFAIILQLFYQRCMERFLFSSDHQHDIVIKDNCTFQPNYDNEIRSLLIVKRLSVLKKGYTDIFTEICDMTNKCRLQWAAYILLLFMFKSDCYILHSFYFETCIRIFHSTGSHFFLNFFVLARLVECYRELEPSLAASENV